VRSIPWSGDEEDVLSDTTPQPSAVDIPDSRTASDHRSGSLAGSVAVDERVSLASTRALLERLAVAAPLPELLNGLIALLEEHSADGLVGSVLLLDPDGQHLRSGAAPSLPDFYNEAIDGIAIGPTAGSCGTAAWRREIVVVSDVERDPLWADFRSLARRAGLRACWSTPLFSNGQLLGTFAMYYPEPREPSELDRSLAETFARTVTLAIERERQEQARLAAVATEAEHARRLSRLAEVSLEFATVETLDELVEVVISKGVEVLGADGGALTVRDDDLGVVHLSVSAGLDERVPVSYAQIPLSSRIPGAYVARTGETVLFPDRQAGLAWSEEMRPILDGTGRDAWATLPLAVGGRLLGALVVSWTKPRRFDQPDLALLQGMAAQCAQTLHRIQAQAAQRQAAAAAQRMSEAFQRSLLTRPPHPDDVSVAVCYLPAVEQAQVGGDWYDAFSTAAGATTLVIGDVNGHDRDAAAGMGQVRNILRGLAYDSAQSPAHVLSRLDAALAGLRLNIMATALLMQTEPGVVLRDGTPVVPVRWSSAGHLPPLMRLPDGTVEVLESEPDLLLGLLPSSNRQDTRAMLPEGATLLLYTDGLVERRGEDIDLGIGRLATALAELADLPLEQLCTALVERLEPIGDDDIALLAVRPRAVLPGPPTPLAEGPRMSEVRMSRHLAVAADPAAVAEARQLVAEVCEAASVTGDLQDTAVLLTSEIVTNAVLHAGTPAHLSVWAAADHVRVQVSDESGELPNPVDAADDATGGRGIAMVAMMSTRWGAEPRATGKTVWFEVGG
jgi:GAF domain-containing protein/anti-sigma regulatory factor (Ser/Thr protein kinase)